MDTAVAVPPKMGMVPKVRNQELTIPAMDVSSLMDAATYTLQL